MSGLFYVLLWGFGFLVFCLVCLFVFYMAILSLKMFLSLFFPE